MKDCLMINERIIRLALKLAEKADGIGPADMINQLLNHRIKESEANKSLKYLFETNQIELSGKFKLVAVK